MSKTLMALGAFKFEISRNAYDELSQSWKWRWQANDRIGNTSRLSYMGRNNQELALSGTIYAQQAGKRYGSIEELEELADRGEPVSLVDGAGKNHGRFVITAMTANRSALTAEHVARKIEFEVTLLRYH